MAFKLKKNRIKSRVFNNVSFIPILLSLSIKNESLPRFSDVASILPSAIFSNGKNMVKPNPSKKPTKRLNNKTTKTLNRKYLKKK